MKKQDGDTRKLLQKEISNLLFTLRPNMQQPTDLLNGYLMALDDVTQMEIHALVYQAVRTKWDFLPPSPGELRDLVLQIRDEQRSRKGSKYSYRLERERDVDTGLEITVRVYQEDGKPYRAYRPQDCPEGREFLKALNTLRENYKPDSRRGNSNKENALCSPNTARGIPA